MSFIALVRLFVLCSLLLLAATVATDRTARAQASSGPEGDALPNPASGDVPLRFDRLSLDDGLSQGSIFAILQDRNGFMWFGTEDGLNRYDGYTFSVYKSVPFDSTSLSDNTIRALFEDRDGTLWVGTAEGGLDRLDRATGTFTHFRHDPDDSTSLSSDNVSDVEQAADGTLWVGTLEGLNHLDPETGRATRYLSDPDDSTSLSNNIVMDVYEDPSGRVWVSTANGLNRLDVRDGTFERFLFEPASPNAYNERKPGHIVTKFLYAEPDDPTTLWATTGQGFIRLNTANGEVERFMPTSEPSYQNVLIDAALDPEDPAVFWAVSNGSGLYRFDSNTGHFTNYRHSAYDDASLSTNNLSTVYTDRMGTVWAGSQIGKGLNRFDPVSGSFALYRHVPGDEHSLSPGLVWSVYEAPSEPGVLWVGTAGEGAFGSGVLHRFDRAAGTMERWTYDPNDPSTLGPGTVGAILEDREGTLWVGTWNGGLNEMDRDRGTFTHYRSRPGDSTSLGSNSIRTIYEDREGTLWIGTAGGGLNRMDRRTGTFTRYRAAADDSSTIVDGAVRQVLEDQAGTLWVATQGGGFCSMDRQRETFTCYRHDPSDPQSLSDSNVLALYERRDEPGILWVGTYGGGLNRFDMQKGRFEHFTEQEGLPNNAVYGILEDREGNLWLSTNGGIARFDPETETFRHYDVDSGLQSKEFNAGAYFASPRGELFFGGPNGVNAFFPEQMDGNPYPPQVVINGVSLFGPVHRGRRPAPRASLGGDAITFEHDEKNLTFDYVGLHFRRPERNRYRYMLQGYDTDWSDVGTRRTAIYTNLDPGDYVFRVQAANSDGVWSTKDASLRLTILPPWWQTWWAYVLYGLIVAVGVFTVDRVQRRRLLRKEREVARIRENQLRAEAAEAQALALQAENERKTLELEGARQLQLSMLPREVPEHPCVDLAAYMKTATEVGGDYYDFDVSDDGTLTIAIGDATGHGVQAGTMVAATKSALSVLAEEDDLERVLTRSTAALKRMGLPKLYMALALARLRGRTLEMAGAGMPPALVFRQRTRTVERVSLKGMPLGGPGGFPYETFRVDLEPGDTVVFMSDGFPELFGHDGEMLGYERAVLIFEEAAARSPREVIDHFNRVVTQWTNGNGQADDVTFVVMKAKPNVNGTCG